MPVAEVAARLQSDAETGLSNAEAARRLRADGPNEPVRLVPPSWRQVFLRQFESRLILILLIATVISFAIGEWLNATAIGVTVLIAALFGFANEFRSERAIAALRDLTALRAEVIRGGLHEEIPARDVVLGDLIVLSEGHTIPADARVVEARGLLVNESILTGEAVAVGKSAEPHEDASSATDPMVVSAGTVAVAGSGRALTTATGGQTSLGSIFASIQTAERRPTPLEGRLDVLGNRLIALFLVLCLLVSIIGIVQGRSATTVFELAISLAVGAVPEGLPAVATTALAVAVRQLARRNVLVRRLDAVETLGSTTIIATDKTGTLTENRQVVREVILPSGRQVHIELVSGDGPALRARVLGRSGSELSPGEHEAALAIVRAGALCSDAVVEYDGEQGWHVHGDPSEGAIVLTAAGFGLDTATLQARYPRLETEPFTSASRSMITTHAAAEGGPLVAVKGAPERVMEISGASNDAVVTEVKRLSAEGFRVFGVAAGSSKTELEFLGAIVLEDPLRADASDAVQACRDAGVRLLLVTGDQLQTAENVGRETGILRDGLVAVLAADLHRHGLADVGVIARASHHEKREIVLALQAEGAVVAMTGDGVNDAPALRAADVGVAVGPNATDVAKEAAQIFLSDGRLSSLAEGISEGRQIVANLRQAIVYLLTASFGTIVVITVAMMFTEELPLAPLQILWLNLVVHVFPALALATGREPSPEAARPSRELLSRATWLEIAWRAAASAGASLAAVALGIANDDSVAHDQTLVFATLGLVLAGQAMLVGVRSLQAQPARLRRRGVWLALSISATLAVAAIYLPGLSDALDLTHLSGGEWAMVALFSVVGWNAAQLGAFAIERLAGESSTA
jgi:Ca2+-transporting ATPase